MTGVSKNCWVTLAGRNIDHYPLLIKTILKPQGVRFSSDNSLAQGGTPSTSVPRQQISIRIVQKSFNKKPLLHFSVSFILLVPQVLTGLVAGSGVVSGHLSPVLFTWFLWRRHSETLWQFAKWSHVHQTHTGPAPALSSLHSPPSAVWTNTRHRHSLLSSYSFKHLTKTRKSWFLCATNLSDS